LTACITNGCQPIGWLVSSSLRVTFFRSSILLTHCQVEVLVTQPICKKCFSFHQPRYTERQQHDGFEDKRPDHRYQFVTESYREEAKCQKRSENNEAACAVYAVTDALPPRPVFLVTQSEKKVRIDPEEDEKENT
jgi:hypothetical protein